LVSVRSISRLAKYALLVGGGIFIIFAFLVFARWAQFVAICIAFLIGYVFWEEFRRRKPSQ
jgi:membrane protein implicated in regulation of membrane protease activity